MASPYGTGAVSADNTPDKKHAERPVHQTQDAMERNFLKIGHQIERTIGRRQENAGSDQDTQTDADDALCPGHLGLYFAGSILARFGMIIPCSRDAGAQKHSAD